jgi:hypothetical protein
MLRDSLNTFPYANLALSNVFQKIARNVPFSRCSHINLKLNFSRERGLAKFGEFPDDAESKFRYFELLKFYKICFDLIELL